MNTVAQEFRKRPITSVVTVVLLCTLVIAFCAALLRQNWMFMLVTLVVAILIYLPRYMERFSKIVLPGGLQIFVICFIYAALFLGDLNDYYSKYPWWDTLLHASSGFAFGIIGFLVLYVISSKSTIKVNPWIIAVFAFSISVAFGAVWEIIEFAIDQTVGTTLQAGSNVDCNSLLDTMKDLIMDASGAFLAALIGYFYMKRRSGSFVNPIMVEFKGDNPKLFNKKR